MSRPANNNHLETPKLDGLFSNPGENKIQENETSQINSLPQIQTPQIQLKSLKESLNNLKNKQDVSDINQINSNSEIDFDVKGIEQPANTNQDFLNQYNNQNFNQSKIEEVSAPKVPENIFLNIKPPKSVLEKKSIGSINQDSASQKNSIPRRENTFNSPTAQNLNQNIDEEEKTAIESLAEKNIENLKKDRQEDIENINLIGKTKKQLNPGKNPGKAKSKKPINNNQKNVVKESSVLIKKGKYVLKADIYEKIIFKILENNNK